ncbi:MAG: gephyrin-like molybdotransferase Glp [Caldilineaceae bacterium]
MSELFNVKTPAQAWALFTQHLPAVRTTKIERIPTWEALNRVLAESLTAPQNLPEFPRSTVDGYAVNAVDTHGASPSLPAFLTITGEVAMGQTAEQSLGIGEAILVHTGGMIPPDATAVVMIEHTQQVDATSIEVMKPVADGENILQIGEDVRQGDLLLPIGQRLRAQEIGGLVALGITDVTVARPPRVSIVSSGDEVVPPQVVPRPGQVRDVNSYALAALVQEAGGTPLRYEIVPDDRSVLDVAAARAFAEADLVVFSAGSSVSYRDMTADVIAGLGQPGVLVHGVSVKPGKPTILAVCDGKPVFGLPGNPVSAMVIFDLFVKPTIQLLLGEQVRYTPSLQARLSRNLSSMSGREDYVQVKVEMRNGEAWAVPVLGKSNLIYTLVHADGVVKVPLDANGLAQGESVTVSLY